MNPNYLDALRELHAGAQLDAQIHPDAIVTAKALEHAISALIALHGPDDEVQRLDDEECVGLFAAAMKTNMAINRSKDAGDQSGPIPTDQRSLSRMLLAHLATGDPIAVASICCALWNRNEKILVPEFQLTDDKGQHHDTR